MRVFLISFFISLPVFWGVNTFQGNLEDFFYAQISEPIGQIVEVNLSEKPPLELEAKSAISIKISKTSREKTLFRKNTQEILPLASLTKLMTALIVLEDLGYDLKQSVTIFQPAADQENVPNYGNLKIGERFSVEKLLELMLGYSSNDAAYALAELIDIDNFVGKMNFKARELGLTQTQFLNPTGLEDSQNNFNYSTADDLASLAKYILEEHPSIFEITLKKGPYSIKNGLSDLVFGGPPKEGEARPALLGGKTGYTDEAGGCLIFLFSDEKGNVFVNVILGTQSAENRIRIGQKLINWINSL